MSGVSPELRGHIEQGYLERHAAKELAALSDAEEALASVDAAAHLLRGELISAMSMAPLAFDQWLGSAFAPTDAERRVEDGQREAADGADVTEAAMRLPAAQRSELQKALLYRETDEICAEQGGARPASAQVTEPTAKT